MEFYEGHSDQIRGNPCGPDSIIKIKFLDTRLNATVTITPYDSGDARITVEGIFPHGGPFEEPNVITHASSLKQAMEAITQVLTYIGNPNFIKAYVVRPAYVPDGDNNGPFILYPCGEPRGEHWHTFEVNAETNKVVEDSVVDELGDHTGDDLSKVLYQRLRSQWPKNLW